MHDKIILYGSSVCPMVRPIQAMLKRANVDFEYIDILGNSAALQRVREINQGYESVPTLVFLDGSTITEPTRKALRMKLENLGYPVPSAIWIQLLKQLFSHFRK